MIDGVKIDVPNLNGSEWLQNDLLEFYTSVCSKTGELKDSTQVANFQGLTFIITASQKHEGLNYCKVQGSLHKYYNQGKHNANDFNFSALQLVIKDLFSRFNINPSQAILRNLEFGLNILTPVPAKEVLKNLVAFGNDTFAALKVDGLQLGKYIGKQQYRAKVYDKGKQYKSPAKNLTRIELAVKKMRYLQPYGITTLNDLQELEKVQPLCSLITSFWDNVIYYDKKLNWKALSEFERKKVLYYAAPRNWQEFNRIQRMRAKKHFQKLISKSGTNSQEEISLLIVRKWQELTAEKCIRFNRNNLDNGSKEMYTNYPLEYRDKTYTNKPKENSLNIVQNPTPETARNLNPSSPLKICRKCRTCKKDISGKKAGAFYCSKKCNNSYQAKRRKMKRNKLKIVENLQLNKLLANLNHSNLLLLVEYKDGKQVYADNLFQEEINAPPEWVRQVIRVSIAETPPVILTSWRAKKLIRIISKSNT